MLINGHSQHFQPYNNDLARRLREILESSNDKCYVGIDGRYFESTSKLPTNTANFIRRNAGWIRQTLLKCCNRKRLYIAAACTGLHDTFNFSQPEYVQCLKKIWRFFKGRNLVIFSGKTVFDNIKYNVFELAANRQHVFFNSIDAWSQYNEIKATAKRFPKETTTFCFILGPAATVLAYDLAQEGYTAWDIGHVAKEYDAYAKYYRGENSEEGVLKNFFVPD